MADIQALQQQLQLQLPSPVTEIHTPLLELRGVQLFIKRDELIHPVVQGNKWRKLKYNLLHAIEQGYTKILSFGGAYSNHLHALARACQICELDSIGIVRGEKPATPSPTLMDITNWGMQLEYISRIDYRHKNTDEFIEALHRKFGDFYMIPEGGDNSLARKGCGELLDELDTCYDTICCEVGSGTMLSALIEYNRNPDTQFLGFAVLKNRQLDDTISHSLVNTNHSTRWSINHDYSFNGFARTTTALNQFITDFYHQHKIQLEPVYSGKMLYGIMELIQQGHFKPGTRILAIHGGGLQGLRGYPALSVKR